MLDKLEDSKTETGLLSYKEKSREKVEFQGKLPSFDCQL
jgi:hypothetical protein